MLEVLLKGFDLITLKEDCLFLKWVCFTEIACDMFFVVSGSVDEVQEKSQVNFRQSKT
jgi:hypothetical protein